MIDDEIGIYQLRIYLACNIIDSVEDEKLTIKTKDNKLELKETNNKLLLIKGSMTFLNEISDVNFFIEDDSVYIQYDKKGKEKIYWLGIY